MNKKTEKLFDLLEIIEKLIEENRYTFPEDRTFHIVGGENSSLAIQFDTPVLNEIIIRVQDEADDEYFVFSADFEPWFRVKTKHETAIEKITERLIRVAEIHKIFDTQNL